MAEESSYCFMIKGKDYIGISLNKESLCPTFIACNKGIIITFHYKTPPALALKDLWQSCVAFRAGYLKWPAVVQTEISLPYFSFWGSTPAETMEKTALLRAGSDSPSVTYFPVEELVPVTYPVTPALSRSDIQPPAGFVRAWEDEQGSSQCWSGQGR